MPFCAKVKICIKNLTRKFAFKFSLERDLCLWLLHICIFTLEMVTDLKGGNLFLVMPFAIPFELLRRCLESQNVNQSFIIKIDFKILFFHLGDFFHCVNHLVLYKRNGLYTIGKKFYSLNWRVRRCVNGLKLYIFWRKYPPDAWATFSYRQLRTIPELSLKSFTKDFHNHLPWTTLIKRNNHILWSEFNYYESEFTTQLTLQTD